MSKLLTIDEAKKVIQMDPDLKDRIRIGTNSITIITNDGFMVWNDFNFVTLKEKAGFTYADGREM